MATGRRPTPRPSELRPFRPHALLRGGHAQTLVTSLPRRLAKGAGHVDEHLLLDVEPGTQVRVLCRWQPAIAEAPTLVLLHGLVGHAETSYMVGLADKAWSKGWNTVRLNLRNYGGTEGLTDTLYHSGLTADLRALLRHLEEQGHEDIHLIGYSIGGNQLLKYLGEEGEKASVRSSVAICPPVDLSASARLLDEKPSNRIYLANFLFYLSQTLKRKEKLLGRRYSPDPRPSLLRKGGYSIRRFDDLITAPHFGFQNAEDYYRVGSSGPWLAKITVPTWILIAENDPLIPSKSAASFARSERVQLLSVAGGGHCGFLGRKQPDEDRYWVENRALEILEGQRDGRDSQGLRL